jgi:nitronate monooxygenase
LLGVAYPIIQAPLASITTAPLAAAVADAGALGSIGSAVMSPEAVRAQWAAAQRPVALNFFVHHPPRPDPAADERMRQRLDRRRLALGLGPFPAPVAAPPFDEAMLAVVLELRPPVVSFHFGLPAAPAVSALKAAGIKILSSATTPAEARLLEAGGADAVIAQGLEAGGHRGVFASSLDEGIGTVALVPQVVDAVKVPVIAAGGLFDGRGIAAALMLGAAGVQLGTAFLGCPEAVLSPIYRRTLGEPRVARTRVTTVLSGRPARAIVTGLVDELASEEGRTPEFPLQRSFTRHLASSGDVESQTMWAGQAAPTLRALPAGQLVAALIRETAALLD